MRIANWQLVEFVYQTKTVKRNSKSPPKVAYAHARYEPHPLTFLEPLSGALIISYVHAWLKVLLQVTKPSNQLAGTSHAQKLI